MRADDILLLATVAAADFIESRQECDSHCRRGRPATTSTRPIDVYIFFELYPTVNVLTVYSASPTTRRSVQIRRSPSRSRRTFPTAPM